MTVTKIQSLVHLDLRKWMFPPKWRFSQCSLAYSSTAANLIQSLAADDTCFSISSGVCGSGIEQLCDILFFRSLGWSSNHDYWDGISKFTLCTCTCLGLTSSFLLLVLHGKVESQSSWTSSLKWWPPPRPLMTCLPKSSCLAWSIGQANHLSQPTLKGIKWALFLHKRDSKNFQPSLVCKSQNGAWSLDLCLPPKALAFSLPFFVSASTCM